MKNSKQRNIPGQSIRNFWHINPRTRVHDNDPRKSQKKSRQSIKNALKKGDFLFMHKYFSHKLRAWKSISQFRTERKFHNSKRKL